MAAVAPRVRQPRPLPQAYPVAFPVAARHLPSFGRLARSCARPALERRLGPPPVPAATTVGGCSGSRVGGGGVVRSAPSQPPARSARPAQPSPAPLATAAPLPALRLPPSLALPPCPHPPPQLPADVAVAAAAAAQCAQGGSQEETGDPSGWAPLKSVSFSLSLSLFSLPAAASFHPTHSRVPFPDSPFLCGSLRAAAGRCGAQPARLPPPPLLPHPCFLGGGG